MGEFVADLQERPRIAELNLDPECNRWLPQDLPSAAIPQWRCRGGFSRADDGSVFAIFFSDERIRPFAMAQDKRPVMSCHCPILAIRHGSQDYQLGVGNYFLGN